MNNDTTSVKICTKCHQTFPETTEYFQPMKRYKNGLYSQCRKCSRERITRYERRHPEKVAARKREWRKANPEKVKRHKSESQKRNRASANIRQKRWRDTHPNEVREVTRIFQHRRRHAGSKFTRADVELQKKAQTDKKGVLHCWWCGNPIMGKYHIDHRIAIVNGGTNDPGNLCLAHPQCNQAKSNRTPGEFMGRLL